MKRKEILESLADEKGDAVIALRLSRALNDLDERMYYRAEYNNIVEEVKRKASEEYVMVPWRSKRNDYAAALVAEFIIEVHAELEKWA